MQVAIVGAGRIGGNVGTQLAKAGHEVMFSFSRRPDTLAALAEGLAGARAGAVDEAAAFGEAVVLAVPWSTLDDVLAQAGPVAGKVVVDTTNQFGAGGLADLPETAFETNARRLPGARYAKAFNTLTAGYQRDVAEGRVDGAVAMFFASDDERAAAVTSELIAGCGFEPVRIGGAREVRLMEAPRRDGAVYGEAYRPDDARRIAAAAADDLERAARLASELKLA